MSGSTTSAPWRSSAYWGNTVSLALLATIAVALLNLQTGHWWSAMPSADRWAGALAVSLAYLVLCFVLLRPRVSKTHQDSSDIALGPSLLVVYASQTGFAQQLAERSTESLRSSGLQVRLLPIAEVNSAMLSNAQRVLFAVSTTGEGDPPDQALVFVKDVMGSPASLSDLRYAVLALGDREYENFCGFGHQLDNWLRRHGAQPLFDMVEVDNADESALRHWQHHLGQLSGVTDLPDWTQPRYEPWTLIERRELNPNSVGGSVFHLAMAPADRSERRWAAGDIVEIGPRHHSSVVSALMDQLGLPLEIEVATDGRQQPLADLLLRSHLPIDADLKGMDAQRIAEGLKPLPHREYSIASLPSDGSLQILLRRMLRPDGSPGIGSGWLCDHAQVGGEIALRIRANPNFHGPDPTKPMILVGNGTGMAGLRVHLKERIAKGVRRNWLLYGERNADRDFLHGKEIQQWQEQGFLERLDLAFSRDQIERVYVQQKLKASSDLLKTWVDAGASIYVCGSLAGMAPGVDSVLRSVLTDAQVEDLISQGRYRRDVY